MIRQLPVFKGYTVDARLKQFRKAEIGEMLEFIDFDSEEGDALLVEYIRSIDLDSPEGQEIIAAVV